MKKLSFLVLLTSLCSSAHAQKITLSEIIHFHDLSVKQIEGILSKKRFTFRGLIELNSQTGTSGISYGYQNSSFTKSLMIAGPDDSFYYIGYTTDSPKEYNELIQSLKTLGFHSTDTERYDVDLITNYENSRSHNFNVSLSKSYDSIYQKTHYLLKVVNLLKKPIK